MDLCHLTRQSPAMTDNSPGNAPNHQTISWMSIIRLQSRVETLATEDAYWTMGILLQYVKLAALIHHHLCVWMKKLRMNETILAELAVAYADEYEQVAMATHTKHCGMSRYLFATVYSGY